MSTEHLHPESNQFNRRAFLKGVGGVSFAAMAPVVVTRKVRENTFEPFTPFENMSEYIDDLLSSESRQEHPIILLKDGRVFGVRGWHPERLVNGSKRRFEFEKELWRRGLTAHYRKYIRRNPIY